jgi:hypothetical protein
MPGVPRNRAGSFAAGRSIVTLVPRRVLSPTHGDSLSEGLLTCYAGPAGGTIAIGPKAGRGGRRGAAWLARRGAETAPAGPVTAYGPDLMVPQISTASRVKYFPAALAVLRTIFTVCGPYARVPEVQMVRR